MSVQQRLGVFALAASVCIFGSFQRRAWSQQPASPPAAAPLAADTPVAPPNTEAARLAHIAQDNARMFGSSPDDPGPLATNLSPAIKPAPVAAAMRKVADWQLAQSQQYFTIEDRSRQLDGRIWTWACALHRIHGRPSESLGDPKYLNAMRDMGKDQPLGAQPRRIRTPTQRSLAQTYLEIYLLDKQPDEIAPTKATLDKILAAARAPSSAPTTASPGGGAMPSSWPRPPGHACTPPPATQIHRLPRRGIRQDLHASSTTRKPTSTPATPASSKRRNRTARRCSGRAAKAG